MRLSSLAPILVRVASRSSASYILIQNRSSDPPTASSRILAARLIRRPYPNFDRHLVRLICSQSAFDSDAARQTGRALRTTSTSSLVAAANRRTSARQSSPRRATHACSRPWPSTNSRTACIDEYTEGIPSSARAAREATPTTAASWTACRCGLLAGQSPQYPTRKSGADRSG